MGLLELLYIVAYFAIVGIVIRNFMKKRRNAKADKLLSNPYVTRTIDVGNKLKSIGTNKKVPRSVGISDNEVEISFNFSSTVLDRYLDLLERYETQCKRSGETSEMKRNYGTECTQILFGMTLEDYQYRISNAYKPYLLEGMLDNNLVEYLKLDYLLFEGGFPKTHKFFVPLPDVATYNVELKSLIVSKIASSMDHVERNVPKQSESPKVERVAKLETKPKDSIPEIVKPTTSVPLRNISVEEKAVVAELKSEIGSFVYSFLELVENNKECFTGLMTVFIRVPKEGDDPGYFKIECNCKLGAINNMTANLIFKDVENYGDKLLDQYRGKGDITDEELSYCLEQVDIRLRRLCNIPYSCAEFNMHRAFWDYAEYVYDGLVVELKTEYICEADQAHLEYAENYIDDLFTYIDKNYPYLLEHFKANSDSHFAGFSLNYSKIPEHK